MTIKDIQLLLKFHADELNHLQLTIMGLKTETLRLLEYIEDGKHSLVNENQAKKTISRHNRILKRLKGDGEKI